MHPAYTAHVMCTLISVNRRHITFQPRHSARKRRAHVYAGPGAVVAGVCGRGLLLAANLPVQVQVDADGADDLQFGLQHIDVLFLLPDHALKDVAGGVVTH